MEQKGRRARPEGRLPAEGRQTPPPLAATHALPAALTSQGEGKPWSCDALGVSTPEVLKAPHRAFFETDLEDMSVCCFLSTTMLRCKNSSHAQWGFFFLFLILTK